MGRGTVFSSPFLHPESDKRRYAMKRLISLCLALAMLLSLIPATFSADTDTKPLVYVFTQAVNGGISVTAPKDGSGTRYAGHSFNDIDTTKSAQWRVDGIKEINADKTIVGSSRFWLRGYDYEGYSPSALSIALNVTAEGKMSPEIAFYKRAAGRVEDIWLVRKRDEAGLDDKTLIATADFKSLVNGIEENADAQFLGTVNMKADADASDITYQTLNAVSVTPGEYRLIFVNAEKTEDTSLKGGDIYSFTLGPEQVKILTSLTLSANKTEIELTENAQLTATAVYADGATALLGYDKITYNSSDESIATVDEKGCVIPQKPGMVTITATVKETEISAQIEIRIFDKKLVKASLSAAEKSLIIGEKTSLSVKGWFSDSSPVDMTNATVKYTSVTPDILSVDDNGTVTALREGEGRVRATLSLDGSEISCEITVFSVKEDTVNALTYEFTSHTRADASSANGVMPAQTALSESKLPLFDIENTVSGKAQWGFVNIKQDGAGNRRHQYNGDTEQWYVYFGNSTEPPRFNGETKPENATILGYEIYVPYDGKYNMSTKHYTGNSGYLDATFMLIEKPEDADKYYAQNPDGTVKTDKDALWTAESLYELALSSDDSNIAGRIEGYPENTGTYKTTLLGIREIKKGSYFLLIIPDGRNEAAAYSTAGGNNYMSCNICNFKLTPANEDTLLSFTLKSDMPEIELSEKAHLAATAVYSQSGTAPFALGSLEYKSLDENVATVSEDGVVTPKSAGKVKITATIKGTDLSAETEINIVGRRFANAKLTASEKSLLAGETATLTAHGWFSDGEAADLSEAKITYTSLAPNVLSVDENGTVKALLVGEGRVRATLLLGGSEISDEITIFVTNAKRPEILLYQFIAQTRMDKSQGTGVMPNQTSITEENLKLFDIENTAFAEAQWGFVNIKQDGAGNRRHQYNGDTEQWYVYFGNSTEPPRFNGETKPENATILGYEIYVPYDGEYKISSKYYTGNSGYLDATFMLVKKPENADKYYAQNPDGSIKTDADALWSAESLYELALSSDDSDIVGRIEGFPENTGTYKTSLLSTREIKKGSYFLLIIPDGRNEAAAYSTSGGNNYMSCNICNFKLTPAEYDAFSLFELGAEKNVLEIGETTALAISAEYRESGKVANLSGVTYKSMNTSIATVSEDGIITALQAGKVTIVAEHAEDKGRDEIEIEVLPTRIISVQAEISPKTVVVGSGAAVTAKGYLTTGEPADMTNGEFSYEAITPEILAVDENGNITTHRAGTGKVGVTLTLDGYSAYTEAEITVTDSTPIKSALLSAPETVGYLREADLTLTGEMESGYGVDFSQAQIHWFVESTPEGGVSVTKNNRLYGDIFEAAAEIYAKITLNGNTVTTNPVNVTVVESSLHDISISFRSVPANDISEVALDKHGWELNTELSSDSAANVTLQRFMTIFNTTGPDEDIVLNIDIPNAGVYAPMISAAWQSYSPKLAYVYVDGIFVGEYRIFENDAAERFRSLFLTKGVHTLTIRPVQPGSAYKVPLQAIRFAAQQSLPEVEAIQTSKEKYTIRLGDETTLSPGVLFSDNEIFSGEAMRDGTPDPYVTFDYTVSDGNVAEVSDEGVITAKNIGETTVTVTATVSADKETKITKDVTVKVIAEGASAGELASVEITAPFYSMNPGTEGVQLTVEGKSTDGEKIDLTNAEVIWSVEENPAITVSQTGYLTTTGEIGSATVTANITYGDAILTAKRYFSVREGKVARTYYPNDAAEIAKENASKYSWAKSEVESAKAAADKYVGMEDFLWEVIPWEGVERLETVGYSSDPECYTCRYCGTELNRKYGLYAWVANPFQRKWKIQCPDCKRLFPSNDFESFYELGRDEYGVFDRERALKLHKEMFGGTYGVGYLKNDLYPEVGETDCPVKLTGRETPERWGVDDSTGYDTGRTYSNNVKQIQTYIQYYMHYGIWLTNNANNVGVVEAGLTALSKAYLYTGDEKYGRAGAILMDKVATVYPGYDRVNGKVTTRIWETNFSLLFPQAYDAFYPMYDDPYVVSFLEEKAEKYKIEHKFDENGNVTPETLRKNCEDGICREVYKSALDASIDGNFGMKQAGVAMAAVVLDNHPETDEMLDWNFKHSEYVQNVSCSGGGVSDALLSRVSRDGIGTEGAVGYNRGWVTRLVNLADILAVYDEYKGTALYDHPKYISMITAWLPYILVRRGAPSIGDSGSAANYAKIPDNDQVLIGGFENTKDKYKKQSIEIAQLLWFMRDGDISKIHYDVTTRNPESIQSEIQEIIDTYGEYNFDKSSMLTGHGLGVLRAGTLHESSVTNDIKDTQRDFWMYFGGALTHKHADSLNLGIEAYGIDLSADLGYPEATGQDANRSQWVNKTISHNCVVVNETTIRAGTYAFKPLHFDAKDTRVKVMDVDGGNTAYTETDEYRRTVVMVDYDDEISYGIDFFKVLGGNDHLYSFHANSIEDPEVSENLKFIVQNGGSYASPDVPLGNDPWTDPNNAHAPIKYPDGYTWLEDIKRADNPGESEFWLDYKIKDYRKLSRNGDMDIHMRLTAANDWAPEEVTLANGLPTRNSNTLKIIDHLEYMLIRRKGEMLNTLFTTVIEPYNKERYIKSIKRVDIEPTGDVKPGKTDAANAVRVELVDGRTDYVVYAQNNDVTYRITDSENNYSFDFKGFVGVWTIAGENENIYSYIHDGEMMGTETEKVESLDAAIKGKILDFERELSFENWLDVEFDREVTQAEADTLSDRLMTVEFKGHGNAAYIIESVDMSDATHGRINFGNVSLIKGPADYKDESKGYTYDVAVGKSFEIPMSYEEDNAPVFDEISDNYTTSAGSTITVKLNATADDNGTVTYSARTLPRGASFNAETATFSWKPTGSQVGDSLVAIDAVDEFGRIATQYFTVTVYGATTGSSSDKTEENSGTSTGGGGGGGGGAAPETSDKTDNGETDTSDESLLLEEKVPSIGEADEVENGDVPQFVDLGNHAWAAESINSLADDGIVKGTTARTYSPQNNITRADFALLLVRAFKLESDDTENFDDVSVNDYYASELAIARNTGIVNGIGDNKYAPRNTITRQDMMVIVYRALQAFLREEGEPSNDGGRRMTDVSDSNNVASGTLSLAMLDSSLPEGASAEQYPDSTTVAPYATDAVSALIGAGLVNGKSGRIAPTDYTTRAEVAVLIKRILDFIE